jgi:Amt family ammonium transporter
MHWEESFGYAGVFGNVADLVGGVASPAARPPALPMLPVISTALLLLIPLAAAALALMNAGLGRSRSAAHAMLASLLVAGVAMLVYAACGFSWQGFPGRASNPWIGAEPLLMRAVRFDGSLVACLQMFAVAVAALIPLGAGNDRWRMGASCASTALLAGWTYPVFAHWAYSGWLARLGYLDTGGAGTIQAVGGVTALAIATILGPRRGKYVAGGMPAAIPGHNMVLVLFGCFLAWIGWIGLNGSGALRYGGAAVVTAVAINTTLTASAAALAAAAITRVRFGRPDASLCANGWTGGLVASSAACAAMAPAAAIVVGAIAGALVMFSVEWLDVRFAVDDPAGSISVHAVGGICGLVLAGVLGYAPMLGQLAGVTALILIVLPVTYGLNRLLNRFYPQRVAAEGEADGMDLNELGAEAYPEFITRREGSRQR